MQKIINFYRANAKLISFLLALFLPSLLIVSFLWLPFGFTSAGLLEEWGLLGLFTTYGPIFFEHISGPLGLHALRPLMVFPLSIAYTLDPNSFYYWHVLTILSLLIKGMTASYLIWIATGSRFWAALMGILILLYPADTMQLALRPLQINWALALLLLGSSLFIFAYQSTRTAISYTLAFISPVLLLSAIFMYEATCTLVLLPLMILYVRGGFKKTFQQCQSRKIVIFLWLSVLVIYIIYYVVVSRKINSYQSQIMTGNLLQILSFNWPKLFSVGMLRGLLGGWFDALRMTLKEFGYQGYIYLTAITTIIGAFPLYIQRMDNHASQFSSRKLAIIQALRLGMVGILLLCLGYAPFLVVTSHLLISQRTFLFASPGAAMVWIAFLIILFSGIKIKWLTKLFAVILIFLGLGAQLYQFHHYQQLSDTQRYILKNIVENFNGDLNNKTLLILDESNQLDRIWMFLKDNLAAALTYFYQKPIDKIEICYLPTNEWRSSDELYRTGRCIENKNGWIFRSATTIPVSGPGYAIAPRVPDMKLARDNLIILTIKPDGFIFPNPLLNNYREELKHSNSLAAIRYRNILANEPSYFHFKKLWVAPPKDRYKWSFGNWWSLEIPIKGSGWREANWIGNYFNHYATAWKSQEISTLLFDLVPSQANYYLRGQFGYILSQAIYDSIQIKINQKLLTLHWDKDGKFEADIPAAVLLSGLNTIEFISKVDHEYFGLSAQLNWYEITPKK